MNKQEILVSEGLKVPHLVSVDLGHVPVSGFLLQACFPMWGWGERASGTHSQAKLLIPPMRAPTALNGEAMGAMSVFLILLLLHAIT